MSYLGYELTAGDALLEVQELCRHAARQDGRFTAATVPTLVAVERWLTTSYYWIAGQLRRHGFDTVQTNAVVLGILQQLNVYDACLKVEMSFPVESSSGEPNSRFQFFLDRREELLEMIGDGTLAAMGAEVVPNAGREPVLTGQFLSRKQLAEDNTDRTQHRVRREQFTYPGVWPQSNVWMETDWQ